MEAGLELDAALAEAMGWTLWNSNPQGRLDAWLCWRTNDPENPTFRVSGYRPSMEVGLAIAAAEELRRDGKIQGWAITVWPNWEKPKGQVYILNGVNLKSCDADGDSPAHALTLALLAALRGRSGDGVVPRSHDQD